MDLKKYDLTHDEADLLVDILQMDGFKVLLKCMELETRAIEQSVLSYHVTGDEKSKSELIIKKAEAQGVRALLKRIKDMRTLK